MPTIISSITGPVRLHYVAGLSLNNEIKNDSDESLGRPCSLSWLECTLAESGLLLLDPLAGPVEEKESCSQSTTGWATKPTTY